MTEAVKSVKQPNAAPRTATPRRLTYRLNRPLLLWTIVLFVGIIGLSFGSRRLFMSRTAQQILRRAEEARGEEKWTRASQLYAQYLQLTQDLVRDHHADKKRADVLVSLGEAIEAGSLGTPARLVLIYEDALRLNSELIVARRRLVPLLTGLSRHRDALQHLKALEATAATDEDVAELSFRAARCHELLEEHGEATRRYRESIERLPAQFASYQGLARVWASTPSLDVNLKECAGWPGFEQLLSTWNSERPDPTEAAITLLLDRMVRVRPDADAAAEAEAVRAISLLTLALPADMPPLGKDLATAKCNAIMQEADANQDRILAEAELNHASVPALSDGNRDGKIEFEELLSRVAEGDVAARRREAEGVLSRLLQLDSPSHESAVNHLAVLLAAAQLEALGSHVEFDSAKQEARLEQVRAALAALEARFPWDPRIHLLIADVEQRASMTGSGGEGQAKHLENAEAALRRGLEVVATADDVQQTDEWTTAVVVHPPAVMLLQLKYALGETLLTRAALAPELSGSIETQVEEIIDELRASGIDSRLPLLLTFRHKLLQPQTNREMLRNLGNIVTREVGQATSLSRQAALLLAKMYTDSGDLGSVLHVYRRQLNAEPLWHTGRINLAMTLEALGRREEAISQYESIIGVPGVAERLAVILMIQQAQRPAHLRDWQRVESVIAQSNSYSTGTVQGLVLQAELAGLKAETHSRLGDLRSDRQLQESARQLLTQVEQQLREAVKEHPKTVGLWTALASTLLRRNDLSLTERLDLIEHLLDEARSHLGPHAELALVELNASEERGSEENVQTAERLAGALDSFPEEGRLRLVLALERTLAQAEKTGEARRLVCGYAQRVPRDVEFLRVVSRALLRDFQPEDKDWQAAWAANLKQMEVLQGTKDGYALLARTERLLVEKDTQSDREQIRKQARENLATLRQTLSNMAAVHRALGFLEDDAGNSEAAIRAYLAAYELGDHSGELVTRLVTNYYRCDRFPEGDRLIAKTQSERENAITGELARLAWISADRREQYEQAAQHISQAAKDSGDHRASFAAALYKFRIGQLDEEVLDSFTKQAHQAAKNASAWVPLILYHVRSKDWEAAEQTVQEGEAALLEDPRAENVLWSAWYWEFLALNGAPSHERYWSEATRRYDEALRKFSDNHRVKRGAIEHYLRINNTERVRTLLTELLDPAGGVPLDVRGWAQRLDAELLARSGNYADVRAALAALDRAAASGADKTPDNLRARIQLALRNAHASPLAEQASLFAQLQAVDQLQPRESLNFALILDRLDRWDEAKKQFETLIAAHPEFSLAREQHGLAMLRRLTDRPELLSTLDQEVARLRQDAPRSGRTAIVLAQSLAARGKRADAVATIKSYVAPHLKAQGEERLALQLAQENTDDLFWTVTQRLGARGGGSLMIDLRKADSHIRNEQFVEASRLLATTSAASMLEEERLAVVMESARLLETWDVSAAEEVYQQLLAVSSSGHAARELARLYVKQRRFDDATALCEAEWERITPPGIAFILSMMARTGQSTPSDQFDRWRSRLLAEAETLTPAEQGALFLYLGNYDNESGHYAEAISEYARANELSGQRFDSLNNYAFLSARMEQNLPEAAEAIEVALRIAGPRPDLLDTRALVLLAKGQPDEALVLLNDLTAKHATGTALFRLAECYHRKDNTEMAQAALKSAFDKGLSPEQLHPLDRAVLAKIQSPTGP